MGICWDSRNKENKSKKNSWSTPNEIYFEVVIGEDDINKKIYFLDNTDFTDPKTKKKHDHDFLTELNSSNTKLIIIDKETEYKKYFIPNQKGIYRFKLVFSIKMTNCSYMFYNCKNLLKVDFSKFNTDNITDISYMFYCCNNLLDINFTNFNTSNVTNMAFMFYFCSYLTKLDLSGFNTKNVKDMSGMFFFRRLNDANLSNFETSQVNNMDSMFKSCCSLKNLDLSSFNVNNVTNYDGIFDGCNYYKTFKLNKDFSKKIETKPKSWDFMPI